MKIYLAADYSRRLEILEYAKKLVDAGHEITSDWLLGDTEEIDKTGTSKDFLSWATHDIAGIQNSNMFVFFAEEDYTKQYCRGGRFVELGYALACKHILGSLDTDLAMKVHMVGLPEANIFTHLTEIVRHESVADLINHLKNKDKEICLNDKQLTPTKS